MTDFCIFFATEVWVPKELFGLKKLIMFIAAFVEAKISETSQILHFFHI